MPRSRSSSSPAGRVYFPASGSFTNASETARLICSGVANEGRPQVSEAAPGTRALRTAISLMAESLARATGSATASGPHRDSSTIIGASPVRFPGCA